MVTKPVRRVLYIDPAGQLWGSEQSLILLLKHIDRHQFHPSLCLPPQSLLGKKANEMNISCFPYFRDNLHCSPSYSFKKMVATFGLFRAAYTVKPDLVHLNQAGAIRCVLFLRKFFPCPLVVHVRLAEDAPLIAKRIGRSTKINLISNSKFVYDRLIKNDISPKIVDTVYNPIDRSIDEGDQACLDQALPKELGLLTTNHIVGFVGRISENKGIKLFLHAMQRTLNDRSNVMAVIIGDSGKKVRKGDKDYFELMKELACQLGIIDHIVFLGFREDATRLMKYFKVFVLASDEEPWGRVICESFISGVPVVATDAGGAREIVQSGRSGFLVPPGDPKAMAAAIIRLLDSPDLAQKMANIGQDWVKNNCDPLKHADAVMKIYRSLC